MSDDVSNRRLTTVLAADVVGYSRLMSADEVGTISQFKRLHDEVFAPLAAKFHGRIIKLMGDGLLMEFTSVVDAVCYAVRVQQTISSANAGQPAESRMEFRIGINIGDVIADGDDILGNGVNVAARLEALADPGGVCVSGTVYEHVKGKTQFGFEEMGQHQVKNIPEPVTVFRVVPESSETRRSGPIKRSQRVSRVATVGLLVAALGLAVGFVFWPGFSAPADNIAATERLAFPLPDKPSIAVLPFKNLSDHEDEEVFADGITEDLITDLSKVSGLFVISRNSSFPFKGEGTSIGSVAERLGIRYVLEGSVRRSGDMVRVNTQLIDTTTGRHVWAERFDGEVSDIFSVQDRIVVTTVDALRLNLTEAEKSEISKRDTQTLDAKAAFQKGWALFSRFNADDNARSVPYFEEAIRLDPEYGRAYGALALVYLRGSAFGWDKALGEQEATLRHFLAPKYLKEAEKYGTSLVHVVRAMQGLFYRHTDKPMGSNSGTDDARREAGAAIAIQPSDPEAHIMMAWALIAAGKSEEGLNFVDAAKRLNPNYPSHYTFFEAAGHIGKNDLEGAAAVLRAGLDRDPNATELAPLSASVFAALGLRVEAAGMLDKWRPGASEEELDFAIAHYRFPITWVARYNWLNTRLSDGLRLAAVPGDETVFTLVNGLGQNDTGQDVLAIRKLGWFGPAAAPAVPKLIDALSNDNKRIRREAAIALGKIGPAALPAVPRLQTMVDEPIVGFHAASAIEMINDMR